MASLAVTVTQAIVDRLIAAMQADTFSRKCPVERRYFRQESMEEIQQGSEQIWVGFNAIQWERLARGGYRRHNYTCGIAYIVKLQSYGNEDIDPLAQMVQELSDWLWKPTNQTFTSGNQQFVFNVTENTPAYQQDWLDQNGIFAAVIPAIFTFGRVEP